MFDTTQMKHYFAYESVRDSGEFNMWSLQAQLATGLTTEQYLFAMRNYDDLRKQAEEDLREATMTSNLANQFDIHY